MKGANKQRQRRQSDSGHGSQNRQPLSEEEAVIYLEKVKTTFIHQSDVYDRFLAIMKDFKAQNINTPGVIQRVSELFKGHPDLMYGFNTFLPPGFHVPLEDAEGTVQEDEDDDGPDPVDNDQTNLDRAIVFYASLNKKLKNQSGLLAQFWEALQSYETDKKLGPLCDKVVVLFEDYPNYLERFQQLLPADCRHRQKFFPKAKEDEKTHRGAKRGPKKLRQAREQKEGSPRPKRSQLQMEEQSASRCGDSQDLVTFFEKVKNRCVPPSGAHTCCGVACLLMQNAFRFPRCDTNLYNQILAVCSMWGSEMLQKQEVFDQLSSLLDMDLLKNFGQLLNTYNLTCEEMREFLASLSRVPKEHKRKASKWGPSYRLVHHSKQISKATGLTR